MELQHLQNFLIVLEQKSISNAASVIRIAQPALSRQLQALEQQLGSPLFIRHRWGVIATPAGEVLARHARDMLHHIQLAQDEISTINNTPSGTVSVGVTSAVASVLLPPLAMAAQRAIPGVRFRFVEGSTGSLQQQLLGRELDLAVIHLRGRSPDLEFDPLLTEPVVLAGGAGMFANGESMLLQNLLGHQSLVTAPSGRLRLLYENAVVEAKLTESTFLEVDSFPALVEMLALGAGFSLLPYSTIHAGVVAGRLSWTQLAPTPLMRRLVVAYPGERLRTPASQETVSLLNMIVAENATQYQWQAGANQDDEPLNQNTVLTRELGEAFKNPRRKPPV